MNLKSFMSIYDLHDSGIEKINYSPEKEELVIDLILCNWRQAFYKAGEPELVTGKIRFTGVSIYELQANNNKFDQDEILKAEIIQPQNAMKEAISMTLLAIYFPGKEEEIKLVTIEADAVTWEPTGSFEDVK